ncbi:hypothetical protein AVEN_236655-1 [Araneus ventricosus]|uniref:Uncharacterized protein n=1 Tax=Araneus ventricosus TaxID=182803 RepID=A0A4Y2IHB8_ARAVE|nr:hypothetical protein AVEN_236655-1 [Araneus ventricosus]
MYAVILFHIFYRYTLSESLRYHQQHPTTEIFRIIKQLENVFSLPASLAFTHIAYHDSIPLYMVIHARKFLKNPYLIYLSINFVAAFGTMVVAHCVQSKSNAILKVVCPSATQTLAIDFHNAKDEKIRKDCKFLKWVELHPCLMKEPLLIFHVIWLLISGILLVEYL